MGLKKKFALKAGKTLAFLNQEKPILNQRNQNNIYSILIQLMYYLEQIDCSRLTWQGTVSLRTSSLGIGGKTGNS